MANFSEFVARVRREMEESTSQVWSDTSIMDWTNDATHDLAASMRYNTDSVSATTTAGTASYALDAETLEVLSVVYDGTTLLRETPESYKSAYLVCTTSGVPNYWCIMDRYIYLRPTPDSAANITYVRHHFPARVTSTTATSEMPFGSRFNSAIAAYVKAQAFAQIGDWDSSNSWENRYANLAGAAMAQVRAEDTGSMSGAPVEVY